MKVEGGVRFGKGLYCQLKKNMKDQYIEVKQDVVIRRFNMTSLCFNEVRDNFLVILPTPTAEPRGMIAYYNITNFASGMNLSEEGGLRGRQR